VWCKPAVAHVATALIWISRAGRYSRGMPSKVQGPYRPMGAPSSLRCTATSMITCRDRGLRSLHFEILCPAHQLPMERGAALDLIDASLDFADHRAPAARLLELIEQTDGRALGVADLAAGLGRLVGTTPDGGDRVGASYRSSPIASRGPSPGFVASESQITRHWIKEKMEYVK